MSTRARPDATTEPRGSDRSGAKVAALIVGAVVLVGIATAVIMLIPRDRGGTTDVTGQARSEGAATHGTAEDADVTGFAATTLAAAQITPPPTTAPTTTAPPKPGEVRIAAGVNDPLGAAATLQELATALAHGNWDAARARRPDLSGDNAQLESGYGALSESTVIVSGISPDGTEVDGAYLAWETTASGDEQSSIFCRHWTIDGSGTTVTNEASNGGSSTGHWSAWVDPADVADEVIGFCR